MTLFWSLHFTCPNNTYSPQSPFTFVISKQLCRFDNILSIVQTEDTTQPTLVLQRWRSVYLCNTWIVFISQIQCFKTLEFDILCYWIKCYRIIYQFSIYVLVKALWLCLWELWHFVMNMLIMKYHNSHKHCQNPL